MTSIHHGKLRLSDGQLLEVDLEIVSDALRIITEGRSLGAWPLRYCRVRGSGKNYQISIDGELADFAPDNPVDFARSAATDFLSSALSDRIVAVKSLPPAEPPPKPSLVPEGESKVYVRRSFTKAERIQRAAIGIGSALVIMIVFAAIMSFVGGGDDPGNPGTIGPLPESTTTTEPIIPGFTLSAEEFAQRWNQVSIESNVPSQIPVKPEDGLINVDMNEWVNIQIEVVSGKVDSIAVTVIPTGNTETDRLSRAVWSVVMQTVSPELPRQERVMILDELGLDINTLDVSGVSGQTIRGPAKYSMAYYEAFNVISFQAVPVQP